MDALERFDPAVGTQFSTFAQARIRGAVLDELRALDWTPRSVRDKARTLNRAQAEASHRLQRAATPSEMAQALKLSLAAFHRLADTAQAWPMRSLEAMLEAEGDSVQLPCSSPQQEERLERQQLSLVLKEGMEGLHPRERTVLALYYEGGWTLKQIAKVLGVTESRVCRIRAALLLKLRQWMDVQLEPRPQAA
jgi:RNA polymerase sigma factor for flagellar operon FliA